MTSSSQEPPSPLSDDQGYPSNREFIRTNRYSETQFPLNPRPIYNTLFPLPPISQDPLPSSYSTRRAIDNYALNVPADPNNPAGNRVEVEERSARLGWVLVPVLCLLYEVGVLSTSLALEEASRLRKGSDIYGNVCGVGDLSEKPYAYFPHPKKSTDVVYCLEGCPLTTTVEAICGYTADLQMDDTHVCFDSYPSKPYLGDYCLPAEKMLRDAVAPKLSSNNSVLTMVAGDIITAVPLIAVAGCVTVGVFLVYILFITVFVRSKSLGIVYSVSMYMLVTLLIAVCFFVYREGSNVSHRSCGAAKNVIMENCIDESSLGGYRSLFWATVSVSLLLFSVTGHLHYSKSLGLHILLKFKPVPNIRRVCFLLSASLELTCIYILLVLTVVLQASIGQMSTSPTDQELTPNNITVWSYSTVARGLIAVTVLSGLWILSLVSYSLELLTAISTVQSEQSSIFRPYFALFPAVIYASIVLPWQRTVSRIYFALRYEWSRIAQQTYAPVVPSLSLQGTFSLALQSQPVGNPADFPENDVNRKLLADSIYLEAILWLVEMTITLLAPVIVFIDPVGVSHRLGSHLAIAVVVLPYSYFFAGLFSAYVRGFVYANVVKYALNPADFLEIGLGKVGHITAVPLIVGQSHYRGERNEEPMNAPSNSEADKTFSRQDDASPHRAEPICSDSL